MADKTRHSEVLADFVKYCEGHPHERFWQALRNWSGHGTIFAQRWGEGTPPYDIEALTGIQDTFAWEGKDK